MSTHAPLATAEHRQELLQLLHRERRQNRRLRTAALALLGLATVLGVALATVDTWPALV